MMEILLTHAYFIKEDFREQEIMKPYVPLGILYVSAWLEKNGIENEIYDSTFFSFEEWSEYVELHQPKIIGIYTNLMTKLNVLKMIQFIRGHENLKRTKIVLGGPEVRSNAENFLQHGADVLVVGEGEETFLEVVQCNFSSDALRNIPGIAFIDDKVIFTAERLKLKNLDELPMPNRKKIDLHLYLNAWEKRHGYNTISINTMRGCPYTCKWCSRAVYGQSYRRRSAAHVCDEIEYLLSNFTFSNIWFVDDVFTVSHSWLQQFHDELKKRNLKISFECITRADRMNDKVIELLKASGCFRVWIGAESGSQQVIDNMDRRVDVQQVRTMIQLTKKSGMEAGTFIMLGYPGETENDIEETINHLSESDPDHFTITLAYPIKGTSLYSETEKDFLQPVNWTVTTDRMIDFKRTYSRKYYDYALRRLHNEVAFRTSQGKKTNMERAKFKLKSEAARILMRWQRLIHSQ